MRFSITSFLVSLTVVVASQSRAATAEDVKPKLAVMPLKILKGVDKGVARILVDTITVEVSRLNKFEVMSADDISALLGLEKIKDALGCDNVSCAAEIGGALGTDLMVSGNVSKLGGQLKLTLALFDSRQLKVLKRVQKSVKDDERLYDAAVVGSVRELFGLEALSPSSAQSTTLGERPTDWVPEATGEQVIVSFSSEPVGAVVSVDGKLLCQDTSKGCSKMLAAGAHRVSMQMENYLDRSELVPVEKGTKISWKLSPNFGWLTVHSTPPGLDVAVNGKVVGKSPIEKTMLAPGSYEVLVQDPCYFASGKKIAIKRESAELVDVTLTPREGAVNVTAEDTNGNALEAEIAIDGNRVGTTPGVFKVGVCAKKLEVRHQKAGTYSQSLVLKERQTMAVKAVLRRQGTCAGSGARLLIKANDGRGCRVTVGTRELGPDAMYVAQDVPVGDCTIDIECADGRSFSTDKKFTVGQLTQLLVLASEWQKGIPAANKGQGVAAQELEPGDPLAAVGANKLGCDASCALRIVDAVFEGEYRSMRISELNPADEKAVKNFEASAKAKHAKASVLEAAYRKLATMGQTEVQVAARCRLGDVQYYTSDALQAAPIPTQVQGVKLPEDIKQQLREQLLDMARPSIMAAYSAYVTCLAMAAELKIQSQLVKDASERMSRLKKYVDSTNASEKVSAESMKRLVSICEAVAAGKRPNDLIGNDQARIQAAWDLMLVRTTEQLKEGDTNGAVASASCAMTIVPASGAGAVACAQLRANWVAMQDGAGMLKTRDALKAALSTLDEATACDRENPDIPLLRAKIQPLFSRAN